MKVLNLQFEINISAANKSELTVSNSEESNASISDTSSFNNYNEIDSQVRKKLKTDGGQLYSTEAEKLLESLGADYAKDLILEATSIAGRENVQQIGVAHVKAARLRLLTLNRRSRFLKFCGSFGGVLIGIGASPFVASEVTPTPSFDGHLLVAGVIAVAIGCILLTISIYD